MIRITVIEPATISPDLTDSDAPIWLDRQGNQYRIASGLAKTLPDAAWMPEDGAIPEPSPAHAVIIAGMDGLEALDAVGLSRPDDDPTM